MKNLYHGSIYDFSVIDLSFGKGFKDFGRGFYATAVKSHAESLAKRNKQTVLNRYGNRSGFVRAYRYNLLFDDLRLKELNVKNFYTADIEWVKFVIKNRKSKVQTHNYDLVIGPTADENTMYIIEQYTPLLRRSRYSDDVLSRLIADLKPEVLPKQYLFATPLAVSTLSFGTPWRVDI